MRIKLLIFLGLMHVTMYSQQIFEPILPNTTLPSPEATSMTTFGNGEASEFTGKINLNIPVYNYTAGQLKWPISLNYTGAGVKIDDFSAWTGINWKLNATGVITRTVNDSPDESTTVNRDYINEQHMLDNASNTCAPDSQYYYNLCFYNKDHDTEVDIFRFSFNGYSGSFYLDENFTPVYLENEHEVKIELIGTAATNLQKLRDSKTFLITTPDGVKYYFGGNETEQSSSYSANRHNAVLANTSFYLFKIEHPVNGTILFDYTTVTGGNFYNKNIHNIRAAAYGVNPGAYLPNPTKIITGTLLANLKYLNKIKSLDNSEEILFNSSQTSSGFYLGTLRKLDNIQVKTANNTLKKIDLSYIVSSTPPDQETGAVFQKRFFLEKVEIDKDVEPNGNKYETYLMEYDAPNDLPQRLSYQQDILGYYNGKTQNTSLVPYTPVFYQSASSFGDRTPDFSLAKKGTLTKITYPTKGYSTFEYEPAPAKEKVFGTRSGLVNTIEHQSIEIPGYDDGGDYEDFPIIYKDQTVSFKVDTYSEYPELDKLNKVRLEIYDLTANNNSKIFIKKLGASSHTTAYYRFDFIKGHSYRVVFRLDDNQSPSGTFHGTFTFDMFTGYRRIDGYGVRIKRQKDFDLTSITPKNIKSYRYSGVSDFFNTVENFHEIFTFPYVTPEITLSGLHGNGDSNGSGSYDNNWGYYYNYHNECYNTPFRFETYDVVGISYGGDNFENGGVEKYFTFDFNDKIKKVPLLNDGCVLSGQFDANGNEIIHCGLPINSNPAMQTSIMQYRDEFSTLETTDNSIFNGKLCHERFYKNQDDMLYKVKEVDYNYTISVPIKQAVNLVGYTLFGYDAVGNYCSPDLSGPERKPMGSCYLGYYYHNSKNIKLDFITTTEFIEPVPFSLYYPFNSDLSGIDNGNFNVEADIPFKKIVSTQSFEYGSLRGLPTRVIATTSDGVDSITENKYANQANNLTGLTSTQLTAFTGLVNQNRLETPIEVAHYKGSELLAKQRTLYKSWNDNSNMILPESIQSSKGSNDLENRVIFSEYDAKGNPTAVSLSDGPKTKYFYNSYNQVYLKIENDESTLDPNVNPISGDECNFRSQYPNALITTYSYDTLTHQILKITDANCRNTYYEYDAFHHLKMIKDHDGNILKEYDNNYRP